MVYTSFNVKLLSAKNGQIITTRSRKVLNTTVTVVFTLVLCCITTITLKSSLIFRRNLKNKQSLDSQHSNHPPNHLPSNKLNIDHQCITPELIGEWKSIDRSLPENQFNAPHCCPTDYDDFHLIIDDSKEFCKIPSLIRPGGHACRCLPGTERHKTLDNSLTWYSQHLPNWDARKSCDILDNRRILVLGDSTLNQAAAVLSEAFHDGGCGEQIEFSYADTLIGKELGAMNRGEHWLTQVEKHEFPEIVIIGVSAHIHTEANFTLAVNEIVDNIFFLRQSHPEVTVVWKTTSPAGCTEKPSTLHPLDAGDLFEVNITPRYYDYWKRFYERDTKMVRKMVNLGVPILDSRMLYGRTDAHISYNDCMHFCFPGPLDVMPPLVQMLLERDLKPSTCI